MNEIVERVARAQCASAGHLLEEFEGDDLQAALELARDGIQALWEPTDEMIQAALALDEVNKGILIPAGPRAVWQAMIDIALRQGHRE